MLALDKPYLRKMKKLRDSGKARSVRHAAQLVLPYIKEDGGKPSDATDDTIVHRLQVHYKIVYGKV